MMKKRIISVAIVIVIVIPVLLGLAVYNIDTHKPSFARTYPLSNDLFKEFVKYYLQFLAVVLGGGILVQEYNRSAQKRESFKVFRRETYKSLVSLYLKVKKSRTLLRFNTNNNELNTELYRSEIEKLIEIKTGIEVMKHEIQSYRDPFKGIEGDLREELGYMESYLRDLLREYHRNVVDIKTHPTISLTKLPTTKKFLDSRQYGEEDSDFGENFRSKAHNSLRILRKEKMDEISIFDIDLNDLIPTRRPAAQPVARAPKLNGQAKKEDMANVSSN